ncbi:formate dehydrogenase accessory sulfurtransferase FdhD [Lawsonibacter faecis]|uniref:Formate dehydrogenase accessory sulfurtransferase FdhD n=1 Tax=Lawsonibacter faecis TaxID=2763052 RepID=A0A8J6JLM8_9FIRM|nr:formate dehydrogenase accessory sulfurtransferase FdhD [Lawsonibacter faecis]MBC5737114.1 formate dehydrogenase accessory sulfurtransferase FdhD [Lawsonibacter faecis]
MGESVRFGILRWEGGGARPAEDDVVREAPYSLWLNGTLLERGACSPGGWEDLALGRLYTAGLLSGTAAVRSLSAGADGTLRVEAEAQRIPRPFAPLPGLAWEPEILMEAAGRFLEGSPLFHSTGGVHSALLTWPGGQCRREDIGRHNAVNKAVGGALRMGAPMGESVLYTSGRLPLSVAEQVIRAGIPVVVSRAAPTDAAVQLAARWGLTVIGFARRDRMNLYTSPEHSH